MVVLFMFILRLNEKNLQHILNRSIDVLIDGGIVAYPTETFYGLGVKFDIEYSLQKLYEIKQRSEDKALPIIIGSRSLLAHMVSSINNTALSLMNNFWPGPLTIILPAKETLSAYLTAGTHSVAVRMPGESFALRLAQSANFPITATSANPSGKLPAQDAETVTRYFGNKIDLVIDGGSTRSNLPSTIVEVKGKSIKIIRKGAIKREVLIQDHGHNTQT